jgi:hypothetical protein
LHSHPVILLVCRDYDGKVTPEEVAAAAMYLKDTLGKEGIQELISCCDVLEGCIILNVSACFNIHLFLLIRGLMHLLS